MGLQCLKDLRGVAKRQKTEFDRSPYKGQLAPFGGSLGPQSRLWQQCVTLKTSLAASFAGGLHLVVRLPSC
ncbi:hypothetical protein ABBQ38_001992 [Trebouxia sp. C0009 RCD-2024]